VIITEIAHFKLRGATREEIVDAVKLFTLLRPDSVDHLAFIAASTTWNYVSRVLTQAAFNPAEFTSLLGYPIIIDDRFAMGRFEVVFTEPQNKNQFVLGLEFPEECFWVNPPGHMVATRDRLWELLKRLSPNATPEGLVIRVSPATLPRITALGRTPAPDELKGMRGAWLSFVADGGVADNTAELWQGAVRIASAPI